ncbi:phage major tail tube protein [Sphingomonas sp. PL-96]|uniref:phage major tail tube protein n=1 Tax=Sphingomonas sp. PL-96 TaxID=2887201 RepID=UPI001E606E12|nr:phage major tail tube protein [Sphingomonas sp. PL-96]MCC2976236.1 phage major tail tube protein [Sphingomonas sp. PL-96]
MGLPAKLKNWDVYSNGEDYAGVAAEITLPKLAEKTESWRGAGMLAEVDVSMGLEKLELEHKYGGLVLGILRQFGAVGVSASMIRFVGAYQEDVAGGVVSAELVVRGKHIEIDPGTAKTGDDTEWTVKSTLSYLRWRVNGRTEVEIDVINNIFIVDGIDRMAEIRAALGR